MGYVFAFCKIQVILFVSLFSMSSLVQFCCLAVTLALIYWFPRQGLQIQSTHRNNQKILASFKTDLGTTFLPAEAKTSRCRRLSQGHTSTHILAFSFNYNPRDGRAVDLLCHLCAESQVCSSRNPFAKRSQFIDQLR